MHGAEAVAAVLARAGRSALVSTATWLNGAVAARINVAGEPAAMSVVVAEDRITHLYLVRNPLKLTRLDHEADLAR